MTKPLAEMTLEELWRLFPIILKPYDPAWPKWYNAEAELLQNAFGRALVRIRHIGSTSVPGLLAKPTIDILLEAAPETSGKAMRQWSQQCGYTVMAETLVPDYRLDLCKGYTPEGIAEKVFHLHIRYPGDWNEPYFCEYLRNHPDCARQYAELKQTLQKRFEHNRDAYTEAKGDFIRHWTKSAREEKRKEQDQCCIPKAENTIRRIF